MQENKETDFSGAGTSGKFSPKQYSAKDHARMGAKVAASIGLFFGLLWLLDLIVVK